MGRGELREEKYASTSSSEIRRARGHSSETGLSSTIRNANSRSADLAQTAETILYGNTGSRGSDRRKPGANQNPLLVHNPYYFEEHNMLWSGNDYWVARSSALPEAWKDEAGEENRRYPNYFFDKTIRAFLHSISSSYHPDGGLRKQWTEIRLQPDPDDAHLLRAINTDNADLGVRLQAAYTSAVTSLTEEDGTWMYSAEDHVFYYLARDSYHLLGMIRWTLQQEIP